MTKKKAEEKPLFTPPGYKPRVYNEEVIIDIPEDVLDINDAVSSALEMEEFED